MGARLRGRHRFWVVASMVVVLFLAMLALPVRNLFSQSAELSRAEDELEQLKDENVKLERRQAELEDPEQVEQLARRNHGMVFPGEESYVVLPPTEGGEVPPWVAKGWGFDPEAEPEAAP
ncbi:MAG: septum formation initiator family protein [Microthrixaceae bacterium]